LSYFNKKGEHANEMHIENQVIECEILPLYRSQHEC
jgi:hypothetical protein